MLFTRRRRPATALLAVTAVMSSLGMAGVPPASAAAVPAVGPSFSASGLAGPFPAAVAAASTVAAYAGGAAAAAIAPAAPLAAVGVPAGDGQAVVSWKAVPAVLSVLPDAYWVQTYLADGTYLGEQVVAPTALSATVTGLVPANAYVFGVLAESSGTFSSYDFTPAVTATGYTGKPGTPVPAATPAAAPLPINLGPTVSTVFSAVTGVASAPPTVGVPTLPTTGVVLGREAWQTYENTDAGSGQTASVNVANGNLVVSAQDSTTIQAHGQLAYTLKRTYNSLDDSTLASSPGSIGAGWRLNLGEELGDSTGLGVTGSGLSIPNPSDLSPGAITLIDRDGTHHTFTPKTTTTSVAVSTTAAGVLGSACLKRICTIGTTPVGQYAAEASAYCADQSYSAPPGVHLGVYRVIAVSGLQAGSACPVAPAATPGAAVAGYIAVRPDRLTTVYAATGEILSMTDRSGVSLDYVYDAAPAPGQALGRLRYVYEPLSCGGYSPDNATGLNPNPLPANCRGYRLAYASVLGNTTVTITDPAGRATVYTLSGSLARQLLKVTNRMAAPSPTPTSATPPPPLVPTAVAPPASSALSPTPGAVSRRFSTGFP